MTDAEPSNDGPADANSAAADHAAGTEHVDAAWITAEALPNDTLPNGDVVIPQATDADLPGDQYLLATSTISHEALGSVDHALHQLTTATDLFDVPVIDFHDHGFGS